MTAIPLPDDFEWTHEPWGLGLRCLALAAVPHVFSTRQLVFPSADGEPQLAAAIGAARIVSADQVHAADVVDAEDAAEDGTRLRADILRSSRPDLGVAVRAADCAPILLASRDGRVVAAVHAGWRGTAAGAAAVAVASLERDYGVRPGDLVAAIGPCIGACCYEVGPELVDAFASAGHARYLVERWFATPPPPRGSRERPPLRLDVALANRDQLLLAGMSEVDVHVSGLCTAMHLDVLTSYRAEREQAGRLVAAIRPAG